MKSPESLDQNLSVVAYANKHKLPELNKSEVANLPKEGWAVKYKSGSVQHFRSETDSGLTSSIVEGDEPVAFSYLGTGEERIEKTD